MPYFSAFRQTLVNTTAKNMNYTSVYVRKNQSHRHYCVLVAGGYDMAGGYSANLFCAFRTKSREKEFTMPPLNRKARDYVAQERLECLKNEGMMITSIRISGCYAVAG